ncbi:MAG: AAA family ATPase [bacterium]|nr:AAA family ATPase [bacterium]
MIQLPGYQVTEQLYKSRNSTIYRGTRDGDKKAVIIKLLNKEFTGQEEPARFRREYEITRKLEGEGIIGVYGLETDHTRLAMILEDCGGSSIETVLPLRHLSLAEKLSLAIQITESLGQIHAQHIIHKDINPSNLLWNPQKNRVTIIDFGISSELTRENPEVRNPNVLEGTINYISPEQTGRMNRAMDYRTDLYSLGVTLYEIFTGQLPFQAYDAMEMVHYHIAKTPAPPNTVNPDIPATLSAIILKLLSKTAEERYQNTLGLKSDLEYCLDQLTEKGIIKAFEIGKNDISGRFAIPQKLYGRERETVLLLAAFDRISRGTREILFIAGDPGIGKSALVNEVHKPITEKRGNFISGKFDQFKRDIPYSAFIQAFERLVKNLLGENEKELNDWKEKLLRALGPGAQVVIDVIPEVELIIGKQPPVQELDPDQERNRFNMVFLNFIRVFTGEDCPLVLFIDDLQWADAPSIQLIEQIMTGMETRYLLIIGAYRDSEVEESHPLLALPASTITLTPLGIDHINDLLSDTLLCGPETTQALADLCAQKTNGNPFFLNQLLYALYEDRYINLDIHNGTWTYDVHEIRDIAITGNVVELMIEKIRKLNSGTRGVLKLASCIGNQFDLDTVSIVCGRTKDESAELLFEALQENLIIPIDNLYRSTLSYRFLHDRIQQAAYSLIEDRQKTVVHVTIGRLLLENIPEAEREENIFDIVNHLNKGRELLEEQHEKDSAAGLNLLAGQRAKKSAAYGPAYEYFKTGIELAAAGGWERDYRLVLSLYEEGAEAAYLNGSYEDMERLASIVLEHADSTLDRGKIYDIKIKTYIAQNRLNDSINTGLEILKQLGINFPRKPGAAHFLKELIKSKIVLRGKNIEDYINFPEMKDPRIKTVIDLLSSLSVAAFWSEPMLLQLIIFKTVSLFVKYGNTAISSFSYSLKGLTFCYIGEIDTGYRFGRMALDLLDKTDDKRYEARTIFSVNAFNLHWKNHARETLPALESAFKKGLESGDFEYAAASLMVLMDHSCHVGVPLEELEKRMVENVKILRALKVEIYINMAIIDHQKVLNLLGRAEDPCRLAGTSYNEKELLPVLREQDDRTNLFAHYFDTMILTYIFQDYPRALESTEKADELIDSVAGSLASTVFYFFDSLIRLAAYATAEKKQQRKLLKKVYKNLKKIKKWAFHAPMNNAHKYYLIKAEIAKVKQHKRAAMELYEKAIELAHENEYCNEEAIASERAAKFYTEKGYNAVAKTYLTRAYHCYVKWGAAGKVKQLEEEYPGLSEKEVRDHAPPLDLSSIIKTAQVMSGEIVLEELLATTMKLLMENAGAGKCFFVIKTGGLLNIEAMADKNTSMVLQSIPVDSSEELARSIIHYVDRTGEDLVLNNASNDDRFSRDPYIAKNKPKSILCSPIIHKRKMSGILYLENNLATDAFTPERLELLRIFSSQAAISIENASLYQNLERTVHNRTLELEKANEKLIQNALDIAEANEKLGARNRVIEEELVVARQLQGKLLPEEIPEISGYRAGVTYIPMDTVGGDFYDIKANNDFVELFIADVSGHGLPGAFLSVITKMAFENIRERKSIRTVLYRVNDVVCRYTVRSNFVTAFYCMIDRDSNKMRYCNAGHFPPIIYRKKEDVFFELWAKGHPLGWFKTIKLEEIEFRLESGDRVLLFTDGITECEDSARSQFGEERFKDFIRKNSALAPEDFSRAIIAHLKEYSEKDKFDDDLCLVVFDVL